jgi:hypothetical protein
MASSRLVRVKALTGRNPRKVDMAKTSITTKTASAPAETTLETLQQAGARVGFPRSRFYEDIAAGRYKAVKAGRRTMIVTASLNAYIDSLPAANIGKSRQRQARTQPNRTRVKSIQVTGSSDVKQ